MPCKKYHTESIIPCPNCNNKKNGCIKLHPHKKGSFFRVSTDCKHEDCKNTFGCNVIYEDKEIHTKKDDFCSNENCMQKPCREYHTYKKKFCPNENCCWDICLLYHEKKGNICENPICMGKACRQGHSKSEKICKSSRCKDKKGCELFHSFNTNDCPNEECKREAQCQREFEFKVRLKPDTIINTNIANIDHTRNKLGCENELCKQDNECKEYLAPPQQIKQRKFVKNEHTNAKTPCKACSKNMCEFAKYELGDTGPGGGIIFYIDIFDSNINGKYKEIVKEEHEELLQWGLRDYFLNKTTEDNGLENTHYINSAISKNICLDDRFANSRAAQIEYESLKVKDWYLPTIKELKLIYENLINNPDIEEDFGFKRAKPYWSSLEYNINYAESIILDGSISERQHKSNECYVRKIRTFPNGYIKE
jgi:hypothetical protein